MAKGTKAGALLVKLVSTAATGYFYVKVSEHARHVLRRPTTLSLRDRLGLGPSETVLRKVGATSVP
jgi:hypothetical protein